MSRHATLGVLILGFLAGCGGPLLGTGRDDSSVISTGDLRFGVWGDSRPPLPDDNWGYPTDVVTSVFQKMQASGAQFAVGTGDYVFGGFDVVIKGQLDSLLSAESNFSGPVYHALGNHDCNAWGLINSNCPAANESSAVRAFMSRLVPSGTPKPYYRVDVKTKLGSVKLLFLAANAWTDDQAAWLKTQLDDPTTYTFVVRHEPPETVDAPGVMPSEDLLASAHYTLALFGHKHTYLHLDARRVISGNAGAPLNSGGAGFGFVLVDQMSDGTISITEVDAVSGNALDTFKVTANGDPA